MRVREAPGTVVLTRRDVAALVSLDACIEAVEAALRAEADGRAVPSAALGARAVGGGFHVKTAVLPAARPYFAAKLNANFPENPVRHGLPTIQGVVALCDAADGRLLALMDSIEVTRLRTAAATAIAARRLARPDASRVTVFGCGGQAWMQVAALHRVRPLRRVAAFDLDRAAAEALARAARVELGLDVQVVDEAGARAAVRTSDLVVTCTTARAAFLRWEHVAPGTFVAAVGADSADKQELDPALLAAGTLVVDSLEQCAAIGELHHALRAGALAREDVHGELAAVVAGRVPGRTTADEITIFDSTGIGLEDAATAALAYERALVAGRGLSVALGG